MKQKIMLVPQYVQRFSCIGSDCEDSCCIGWQVNIDETTYKKYKRVRDDKLSPLFNKKITRNRSNPSAINYAKIKMDQEGCCPFLSEEKLCTIQLKLGEEYLSTTCSTYPRITNKVNEIMEQSLTMSCPEAARLALLNPNKMEFDEIESSINSYYSIGEVLSTTNQAVSNKPQKYFWELRIFTIQVLQNREYTVAERLIILGMFYRKAQVYVDQGRVEDLPQLIASYTVIIEGNSLKEELAKVPVEYVIQMALVKGIADVRFKQGIANQRYLDCFKELLETLNYDEGETVEAVADRYKEAYRRYYEPFMSKHEYIYENYLVNHVFKNMFPFWEGYTLEENYMLMVIHYAMIKLHLIGMAGFHKENFNLDHVIKLIQSFAKTVEHNSAYLKQVFELLKKYNYNTMAYMAILIKN
jgi:lysine-N-methylase